MVVTLTFQVKVSFYSNSKSSNIRVGVKIMDECKLKIERGEINIHIIKQKKISTKKRSTLMSSCNVPIWF